MNECVKLMCMEVIKLT